ncbi:hypothetical protein CWE07_03435 [Aliidiomarina maris]|uniref:Membrane-bound lysozyme inhibitor of c-type lysozyme MliC n=2 Tax=Aliidiomarina maris TaxID=531312 RepID=A0A327X0D2_9GAMM|nr:hypothetical protein B0I24_103163 [Aliidiomarina maris]RUO27683.1 hypothetical protein CWE07_03435 [Aliidiomarina maris]
MTFKRSYVATTAIALTAVLSGCQQTPPTGPDYGGPRAAYSEWTCHGEPVLAQFYGARVVISDSQSSRWLDRGTQVGQVFRGNGHSVRFRDDSMQWTRGDETLSCTPRDWPQAWQEAAAASPKVHFRAQGPQQSWVFQLQGKDVSIQASDDFGDIESRRLPAGEGDYYLDMWTFNIQTQQDRMRIQILDGLCRNQRDQIPYPSSIQINWNDQVLQGCGRWLAKSGYRP